MKLKMYHERIHFNYGAFDAQKHYESLKDIALIVLIMFRKSY